MSQSRLSIDNSSEYVRTRLEEAKRCSSKKAAHHHSSGDSWERSGGSVKMEEGRFGLEDLSHDNDHREDEHEVEGSLEGGSNAHRRLVQVEREGGKETAPSGPGDAPIVIHTSINKLRQAEKEMMAIQNLNVVPESLGKLSLLACVLQFSQGSVMLFLAASNSKNQHTWRPWYTNYPGRDGVTPQPELLANFSILWYSPIFLLLSACQHLSTLIFRKTYVWYLQRNQNPFRWTEYTFSASIIRMQIAQIVGVTDVHLLSAIFVLTALMIQMGATHEDFNSKARADGYAQNWRSFYVSWIAECTSWIFIFTYFHHAVLRGAAQSHVWGLVIVLYLLNSSFGFLFAMQWHKIPPFDDYTVGEKGYICLSFISKTCLAWITFGYVNSARQ